MDSLFESMGLAGYQPAFQWLMAVWILACIVVIPIELFYWAARRSNRNVVGLDRAKGQGDRKAAFLGQDRDQKDARLAAGDAYEGPGGEPAVAVAQESSTRRRGFKFRRLLMWVLILLGGGAIAYFAFGDPLAGGGLASAVEPALSGGSWKEFFASFWFLIVITVGRVVTGFTDG